MFSSAGKECLADGDICHSNLEMAIMAYREMPLYSFRVLRCPINLQHLDMRFLLDGSDMHGDISFVFMGLTSCLFFS